MNEVKILPAKGEQLRFVEELLDTCGLHIGDFAAPGSTYWLALSPEPVGVCGMEVERKFGLLRSLAVRTDHRGRGLARALVRHAATHAGACGLSALYALSKDSGALFLHLGWQEVDVLQLANRLRNVPQVRQYDQSGWYPDERAFRLQLRP